MNPTNPTNSIALQTPLYLALHAGLAAYQPRYPGVELEPEGGDPEVSVRNLRRLLDRGLRFIGIIPGPAGLLFTLTGGEYLATGQHAGGISKSLEVLLMTQGWGNIARILAVLDLSDVPIGDIVYFTPH